MTGRAEAIAAFRSRFGADPGHLVRSPGRVNLIGEHTDYNEGIVMPVAIEQATWLAFRVRDDRRVVAYSAGHGEVRFDLESLDRSARGWRAYLQGVAWALGPDHVGGLDLALWSDIPIGAGLSSSASLEIGVALACGVSAGVTPDPRAMARAGRKAENEWVGVPTGIMDQLVVALAETDRASLIDCRSLGVEQVPFPAGWTVAILDTTTRRELVGSGYRDRRQACESAAAAAGVPALRDLGVGDLDRLTGLVDDPTFRRARHVVTENARVLAAAGALREADGVALGSVMAESHRSMRDDFEISSPALDAMVDAAQSAPGCIGARMTGGGFAGCAVALVDKAQARAFAREVAGRYSEATGMEPSILFSRPVAGATEEEVSGLAG